MRKLLLAALVAGTAASPALAQQSGNFSGVRVEGIVGYDTTEVEDERTNGVVYGAGVGFDVQSGNLVFGVSGEISKSTLDQCVAGVDIANDRLCAEMGRELTIGGRIGTVLGDSTLLYAHAGYTNARIKLDYDHPTNNALDFSVGENLDGVRVGAGLEFAVGPNSFAKVEYRYSNYEQGFDRHQAVAGFGFRF